MAQNYETSLIATFRGKSAGVLKLFWTQAVLAAIGQEVAKNASLPAGTVIFNNSTVAPPNCIPYVAGAKIDFNVYPDLKTVYPTGIIPGNSVNDYLRVATNGSGDWRAPGQTCSDTTRNIYWYWGNVKSDGPFANGAAWITWQGGWNASKGDSTKVQFGANSSNVVPTSQENRPVTTFINAWIYVGTIDQTAVVDETKFFTEDHDFDAWGFDPEHKTPIKEVYHAVRGMGFSDKFYTKIAPPEVEENQAARWNNGSWEVVEDFRDKEIFNTARVEVDRMVKLGSLPEGWTDKPYPQTERGQQLCFKDGRWSILQPTSQMAAYLLYNDITSMAQEYQFMGMELSKSAKYYLKQLYFISHPNGGKITHPDFILETMPTDQIELPECSLKGDFKDINSDWYVEAD